jgi:hypothetical protein
MSQLKPVKTFDELLGRQTYCCFCVNCRFKTFISDVGTERCGLVIMIPGFFSKYSGFDFCNEGRLL